MLNALKELTVPTLRNLGFKGSMPHFFRERSNHIDLLTFQFSQWGGRLVAEASFTDKDRNNLHPRFKSTPTSKLRVAATGEHHRIGRELLKVDPWFIYDQPIPQYGEVAHSPRDIANTLSALIVKEGVAWWDSQLGGS
jgi:hypothetical protein